MLHEVSREICIHVPVENYPSKLIPKSWVIKCFLRHLSYINAIEGVGYLLAVSKLNSVDNGRKSHKFRGCLEFLISFQCRTFLPVEGEFHVGIVRTIHETGVYLKSGPANSIFLSGTKMPNYHYAPDGEEGPLFVSDDLTRIELGVVVRFVVFSTRWNQNRVEIDIVASLEGDGLGPLSLAGTDGLEF